ncbi:MAG TPA: diphosphomevalonate decarboxylase [Crocinitomicaceae bacterium]|nr:diphosphomevalonate decarboxylase [Crocinitomicaceae bacterium]
MNQHVKVRFPSNIALVKYWGKYGNQLPKNASLSMTLSNAYTELELTLTEKKTKEIEFEYFFEGQAKDTFKERILNYLQAQTEFSDILKNYAINVQSHNSFPHSTGIASSASAFAAIATAFLKASGYSEEDFTQQASRLARLGSGSACRSFHSGYSSWGKLAEINGTSDEYATPVTKIHDHFKTMCDAILIVEDTPKKVSSSVGHGLMKNHPFAEARFQQANQHCLEMFSTLECGDFEKFIAITEREALSLHAMMMTSLDYYLLIKPETVFVLEKIMQFRNDTKLPICFTLDAGPNVHLLYPSNIQQEVKSLIDSMQSNLKNVIYDQIGNGGIIY